MVAKGFNSTQYQSPPFCWGDSLQSQILKRGGVGVGGDQKKDECLGGLNESLPQIFALGVEVGEGGACYVSCQKTL